MEQIEVVMKMISELGLPPEKALELKIAVFTLALDRYNEGANMTLEIQKELNQNSKY